MAWFYRNKSGRVIDINVTNEQTPMNAHHRIIWQNPKWPSLEPERDQFEGSDKKNVNSWIQDVGCFTEISRAEISAPPKW